MTWREEFVLYVDLTVPANDKKKKLKLFSYLVDERGQELLRTLMGDVAAEAWKLKDIIEKFDRHCIPSINETGERYRFFMRHQGSNENIYSYFTELKLLTKMCNFGILRDSLIRDRIVCGLHNVGMRERLLREKNLTLDKCIQLCRAAELSRENSKTITGTKVEEVHAVQGAMHQTQKYVPQPHVFKKEVVVAGQQLYHQERKSSLDQKEPELPQIKEEQEEEQLKQEETDMLILTPKKEESENSDTDGQHDFHLLSHNSHVVENQDLRENKQKDSEITGKSKPGQDRDRKHSCETLFSCEVCGKGVQ